MVLGIGLSNTEAAGEDTEATIPWAFALSITLAEFVSPRIAVLTSMGQCLQLMK